VDGKKRLVTYKEWADLIQASFEKCYYVPSDPSQDKDFNINSGMVNRRGIYKDVYGTPKDREWSDYQVILIRSATLPCAELIRCS
jgi:glycogen debranching enzyme